MSAILKFFFVVFNVRRAFCPVQHDYELLFLDLFLLVWDGWWRQHTFSVQPWTRIASHVCGRQRYLHPDPSAAVNMFRHMARKIKIADVIQFSYQLALKWGDYILDQPGRTKVIARNVKKGRQENQGQPAVL